jgi:hypothetical protein
MSPLLSVSWPKLLLITKRLSRVRLKHTKTKKLLSILYSIAIDICLNLMRLAICPLSHAWAES